MGEAWSSSGLPGLPGAGELRPLHEALLELKLEPLEACRAFGKLISHWREERQVLVPPTPAKMHEHLPFVQQILAGELDLAAVKIAAKSSGSNGTNGANGKNGHGPRRRPQPPNIDEYSAKLEHIRATADEAPPNYFADLRKITR